MNTWCKLLVLWVSANPCVADYDGAHLVDAPVFELDLDLPPADRWSPMMVSLLNTHGWQYTYEPVMEFIDGIVPDEFWWKNERVLTAVGRPIVGHEIFEECAGVQKVAQGLGHNYSLAKYIYFQIFYEIVMECTGIVAHDENLRLWHGRNMDIGGFPFRNITATVTWKKGGRPVLNTTQYVGYFGVHTGMRLDGWSVQANERVTLEPGPAIGYEASSLIVTAASFLEGGQTIGRFLRDTLLEARNLREAMPYFENQRLGSPVYLIAADKEEGMIVTRDRDGIATVAQDKHKAPPGAGVERISALSKKDWFMVQTNWDPWVRDTEAKCDADMTRLTHEEEVLCEDYIFLMYNVTGPCNTLCELYSDGRREAGDAMMEKLSPPEIDEAHLLRVLGTPPVLANGTKFTAIMSVASDNHYRTVHRGAVNASDTQTDLEARGHQQRMLRFFLGQLTNLSVPTPAQQSQ